MGIVAKSTFRSDILSYKIIDIIYCTRDDFAKQMFELYINKGYAVAQSTVEIITGTHGKQVVKKLEIMSQ